MKQLIKLTKRTFLDQISNNGATFSDRTKHKYLSNNYNISFEQYVIKILYNGKHPLCKTCKSKITFLGKLDRGRYFRTYCCKSCKESDLRKEQFKKGSHNFNSIENRIKGELTKRYNEYITKKEVYLYKALTKLNQLKIGVTVDPYKRVNFRGKSDLHSLEVLLKGVPRDILLMEYNIKKKFYSKSNPSTEIFLNTTLEEILLFINDQFND